jgi:hypothetical protein
VDCLASITASQTCCGVAAVPAGQMQQPWIKHPMPQHIDVMTFRTGAPA